MKAVSTAGGGVMFIPEELERKGAISYQDLLNEEGVKTPRAFGKRNSKPDQQLAA